MAVLDVKRTGHERLMVRIRDESAKEREIEMTLDKGMFAPHARATLANGETIPVMTKHTYMVAKSSKEWATATIENESQGRIRITGVFMVDGKIHVVSSTTNEDGGAYEHEIRRLDSTPDDLRFHGEAVPIPGKEPIPPLANFSHSSSMKAFDDIFFPGCYPQDNKSLTVQVKVATDWGYVRRVNMNNSTASLADQVAVVLKEVERNMRVVRPIYLAQLNVLIEVSTVVIGSANYPAEVLRRVPSVSCAADAITTLRDFGLFVASATPATAHWHLFTDCHPMPGIVGAGYQQGLCTVGGYNSAVSSWAFDDSMWRTVAHEMGHVFGAQHTFYGGQGGIMDYGSGRLFGGDVQFHPDNGPQMCAELTNVVVNRCPYVKLTTADDMCGNGILEPDEECECVQTGLQDCTNCKSCKLLQPRQCTLASAPYVVRKPTTADFVSVSDPTLVAHPDCCSSDGKLVGRSCNNGRDVCSVTGTCQKACARFLLQACGFDATGCVQKCFDGTQCWGPELVTRGPPSYPAGAVPDGLDCTTVTGKPGTCTLGVCNAGSMNATSQPTPKPSDSGATLTHAPTLTSTHQPTLATAQPTVAATSKPTISNVTAQPTSKGPTSQPTSATLKPTTRQPTRQPLTKGIPSLKPTIARRTQQPSRATTKRPSPVTTAPSTLALTLAPTTASPSRAPTTNAPTEVPSVAPTVSPTIDCPVMQLFYRCPSLKDSKSCVKAGCTWCNKSVKCQATQGVCNVGGARNAHKAYSLCPPFNLVSLRAQSSKSIQCPMKEEMSACYMTNGNAKSCAANAYIKCTWCSKQNLCVPVTPVNSAQPCLLASCPRMP